MIETAWNGHYYRGQDGLWRYAITKEPVPGARNRLMWDGDHECTPIVSGGARYWRVPAVLAADDYVRSICAHHSSLAEEHDGKLRAFLVPEYVWEPERPHTQGGMWAPELEAAQLLDIDAMAALMGFGGGRSTVEPMISRGLLPSPVMRKPVSGVRGAHFRVYWTRPIIEQYRPRYTEVRPCHYDLAKKMTTQRERRAAGLGPVKKRRRA